MAKKKQDEETALTTTGSTAMAVADGVDKNDVRGKEGITSEDVVLPRVSVCQNNSPEKDEDSAKFIDGLGEGDLFNTITQQIYGDRDVKLRFVVIKPLKRAMEFDENRKVVDFNVPWNDPRCEFTTDEATGDRVKPVATRFYDYVVYLPDHGEVALLSFSNTKLKAAKKLNSLITLRIGPSWAGLYTLSIVKEENDKGKFFNFKVDPASKTDAETMEIAARLYEQFKDANIKSDVDENDAPSAGGTDNVPF